MAALIERVRGFVARHRLWEPRQRVLAAVSGGSDSVALLFVLRELASRGEIVLAGLAHLHHHIRGAAADEDAAFCRALADRLGVAAVMSDADVPGEARRHGVSLEVAGRHARRQFYEEARRATQSDVVAVAHTRDDQAETVLLRLTRGAGTAGLGAIAPARDRLVRPLLDHTRDELQAFLRAEGEPWREDVTNGDRSIPRNRIRHEVLPQLRLINIQTDAALSRAAELLRGDDEFLERLANAAFLKCVNTDNGHGTVAIDSAEWNKLPVALARRVARYALETANPDRTYGLEEADDLRLAVAGASVNIPSLRVERFDAKVVLSKRTVRPPSVELTEFRLEIPGTVEAPRGTWSLSAEGPMRSTGVVTRGAEQVTVDAAALGGHLVVRYRRPGDRLQPLGAPGRRKVQDILVDRKVARDDRDSLPIVTTASGEIVWVAGHVLADPFRVTPLTVSVVVLTLRR